MQNNQRAQFSALGTVGACNPAMYWYSGISTSLYKWVVISEKSMSCGFSGTRTTFKNRILAFKGKSGEPMEAPKEFR